MTNSAHGQIDNEGTYWNFAAGVDTVENLKVTYVVWSIQDKRTDKTEKVTKQEMILQ